MSVKRALQRLRRIIESRESEERLRRLADLGDTAAASELEKAKSRKSSRAQYLPLPAKPGQLLSDAGKVTGKISARDTHLPYAVSGVSQNNFDKWAIWDGWAARVRSEGFDPERLTRTFTVQYAADEDGKRLPQNVDTHVVGRNIDAPKLFSRGREGWRWDARSGDGPFSGAFSGVWEREQYTYRVGVSVKELSQAEMSRAVDHWKSSKLVDVSDFPSSASTKSRDIATALQQSTFEATQSLASPIANAADALVTAHLGRYAKSHAEENEAWLMIPGAFKMTARGTVDYMVLQTPKSPVVYR